MGNIFPFSIINFQFNIIPVDSSNFQPLVKKLFVNDYTLF